MRKYIFASILLLIYAGLLLPLTAAQDDTLSEDYNWCFSGEPWGDGRCDSPDPTLAACMWEMGWYLPRVQAGMFSLEQVMSVSSCLPCINKTVVLSGSPYNGWYDIFIDDDIFVASSIDLTGICGLTIYGNDNPNIIVGSPGSDAIFGYGGDDLIFGDSTLDEGSGNDAIYGGSGDDDIVGDSWFGDGSGNDLIWGEEGDDLIYGDTVSGFGSGDDTIDGGAGNDTAIGDTDPLVGSGADPNSTDTCVNAETVVCEQP